MLQLALTPSANDLFTFDGLVNGLTGFDLPCATSYFDLQQLNEAVLTGEPDVCKISLSTLGHVLKDYILLPTGATLGYGNGPKIVAKQAYTVDELIQKSIAIPGKDTTAYLLLNVLIDKPSRERFCAYHQVLPLLEQGEVDCGLLIHESRFALAEKGLYEILDLGSLWEERTGLPLPLGGIVAKRSLGEEMLLQISQAIQNSLGHALDHPDECKERLLAKSAEKNQTMIDQFLKLYVNKESWHLSQKGIDAIEALLTHGRSIGLLPPHDQKWLFDHPALVQGNCPGALN